MPFWIFDETNPPRERFPIGLDVRIAHEQATDRNKGLAKYFRELLGPGPYAVVPPQSEATPLAQCLRHVRVQDKKSARLEYVPIAILETWR